MYTKIRVNTNKTTKTEESEERENKKIGYMKATHTILRRERWMRAHSISRRVFLSISHTAYSVPTFHVYVRVKMGGL